MIRANNSDKGSAGSKNTYNRPNAKKAKLEMRKNVLAYVMPSHVFDAFCGPTGEMYRDVWQQADSYVGCDVEFEFNDNRKRFVADNRKVLRAVDLSKYNVFDFDAFGSPWEQMLILLARRVWAKGERGAVVLTDGGSMNIRFGGIPHALAQLVGCGAKGTAPTVGAAEGLQSIALTVWCKKAKVKPLKMWQSISDRNSEGGAVQMNYTAIVFEGIGD